MTYRVRIEQFDRTIEVGPGETILECALFEGIAYPFSCQQGQCGSCKSLLVAGEVELGDRYNPLALSADERARGLILACQARPRSDCVVSVVEIGGEIVHAERDLECTIVASERVGSAMRVVRLRIDRGGPFNFVAGQYVYARFGGGPEERLALANAPDDALLELHVPSDWCGEAATAVGARVQVRGPHGREYLHDEHLGPILACADDTGLASMLAIVRSAIAIGLPQRLHLYVDATGGDTLYTVHALRSLGGAHRQLSTVIADNGIVPRVASGFDDLGAFRVYAAGRREMLESLHALALARGLPPEHWSAEGVPP
jgi:naphthalene 1,2-dioxygenase ferredoxin reductase component